MKKIAMIVLSVLFVLCITACGAKDSKDASKDANAEGQGAAADAEREHYTIVFKNGTKKLGSINVFAGDLVTGYEEFEKVDGTLFQGWYETPSFLETSKKDLKTTVFTKSTVLYGSFKNINVTEDTRKWYVVGEGLSPVLRASSWAGAAVEDTAKEACRLKATGNVANEMVIEIDLYKDDKFQVIHDWQWEGQYGFGKVTKCDDKQVESSGGLSGEPSKANILVLMDGKYRITLTTDPDNAAQDTFVIERVGDAPEPEVVESEPYAVSDSTSVVVKGSWVADWSENIELVRNEGTYTYSVTKELAAGTELYFMIWDKGVDTGIGLNATAVTDEASLALLEKAYNVKVASAGKYTFTVNAETLSIVITKAE